MEGRKEVSKETIISYQKETSPIAIEQQNRAQLR